MLADRKVMGTVAYVGQGPFLEPFVRSWSQMVSFTEQYVSNDTGYVHFEFGNFSGQEDTRNRLADIMQGDWLLQLDTDHAFEPDVVQRMLRVFLGYDLDVLTGLYQYRTPPYNYTIYKWYADAPGPEGAGGGFRYVIPGNISYLAPPFEVDCCGAGTLLVHRRVFERIKSELKEAPFTRFAPWSEDFAFARRLKTLATPIKIYCAPAIRTFHLKLTEVQPSDYDSVALRMIKSEEVPTIADLEKPVVQPAT